MLQSILRIWRIGDLLEWRGSLWGQLPGKYSLLVMTTKKGRIPEDAAF